MSQLRGRRAGALMLLVAAMLLAALPVGNARAQGKIYFPQTGHFLGGAFRSFWERNGGVEIFGYPVSPEFVQNRDGRVAQYFERARFELDVVNNQAVISLGLIGREYTAARGLGFPPVAPVRAPGLRFFPETGHTLRGEFRNFWERRGSLRIFGYPISEEFVQQLDDGRNYIVQYFERARFELVGNRVRLGLLGSALVPCQLRPGFPPNAPPPGPVPEGSSEACFVIPGFAARVFPEASAPGTTLGFEARGYAGGEEVAMWINLAPGGVRAVPYRAIADADGVVLVGFRTLATDPPGNYSIVGQGLRSGRVTVAAFRLVR
ncbi:MAG: LGFP repeat-containing protein [Chloroflexaceae bacterium]